MTDLDLEQRLRGWYHAEVGVDEEAPTHLRASIAAIPVSTPVPAHRFGGRRGLTLLVAAALLVGGALAAGSGLLHVPSVVVPPPTDPAPTSAVIATASPSVASPSPTPDASPTAAPPLGGGLILFRDVARGADGVPLDTVHGFGTGTYDVYTLDAATGERTLLGTVPYDWRTGYTPELKWASDRTHVLFSDGRGKVWALGSPTAAGRQLVSACCEQSGVVAWALSPDGQRIAGLHGSRTRVPGQQGETTVMDAVVVTNVDGTDARILPLPSGAGSGAAGEAVSWSPDGSAVVVAGCRPCNYADPGGKPINVTHTHLFIVPMDGSRVRELLDETAEGVWDPTWSPDGASIVVARLDCAAKEVQPFCFKGRYTVATVDVADGAQTILAVAPAIASGPLLSPDGRRITFGIQRQDVPDDKGGIFVTDVDGSHLVRLADGFLPRWSPDGTLILFEAPLGDLWIVPADGGQPRRLGAGAAAAW